MPLLAAGMVGAAAPAASEEPALFARPVGDKKAVTLDPAHSYVIVQTQVALPMIFIRQPDQPAVEDYRQRRKAAFDKAHARWTKRHASWVDYVADYRRAKAQGIKYLPPEKEPVEPTEARLNFPPLDLENIIGIGPTQRFAKGETRSTYVTELKPGTYRFYGVISVLPDKTEGTCMCMGTVKFEIKPGQIVNIGTIRLSLTDAQAKAVTAGKPVPKTEFDLPDELSTVSWDPPIPGDPIDPRLAGYTIEAADLRPGGRFPNYYGIEIDRVSAIPGVLAYDRDQQVDLRPKP